MSLPLPARPNLEHLKNQAKQLLRSLRAGDPDASAFFREHHPKFNRAASAPFHADNVGLTDSQLVIARSYGFSSWLKLKDHVDATSQAADPMEALKAAVLSDDIPRLEKLLTTRPELKARLNEPLPDFGFGSTPILAALQRRNKGMMDTLLRAGADINARSDWWAGSFGVLDQETGLESFLIERGARVDAHAAARMGDLDKLKELVAANRNVVHARGGDGQTPLHFARTVAIAEFLLESGARIDATDVDHESTPAQYMVRDRPEVARFLVTRGCRTDVLMAAALGNLDLVQKHIETDPGCVAIKVSDEFFPKLNPRAGGHIYIWTLGRYKTPHLVAREFGHEKVFRYLMEHSPAEVKIAQACELGDEGLFRQLLSARPHMVEKLSEHELRQISDAAQNNNTAAVRMMLSAGWPANARGQHGATALHWAAFHGNAAMTQIILAHHPAIEAQDDDFSGTPLGWAIHGSENGWHCRTGNYPETVEALIEAGAKLPEKLAGTEAVRATLRMARRQQGLLAVMKLQRHRNHVSGASASGPCDSTAVQILASARSVLLVDWPSPAIPRALIDAGFDVFGSSPHQFTRASVVATEEETKGAAGVFPASNKDETGFLVFHRIATRPTSIDVVCVYRPPAELPGIIAELALPTGAKAIWLLRPVSSAEERAIVEKAGLLLIEDGEVLNTAQTRRKSKAT